MSTKNKTLVMKFGGTSVGTVASMRQAVEIVCESCQVWPRLVVVTSALSGITDALINSATRAARGDLAPYFDTARMLATRHHELIDTLVTDLARRNQVHQEVDHLISDFTNLCQAIHVLGEASPRALDAVAGLGERMSVRVLAAAIENSARRAQYVDSTQLVITDDHYQNAAPDMPATIQRTRQVLDPILDTGFIPVVTGFLGATPGGVPTTLGRGGSDYSASILAVALNADEVWIWTDVDGVMTADPRIVPEAHTIPVIAYREVAEMAYFGAKVLHPKSIHPVIEANIELRVCNTFNPSHPGTRLVSERDSNGIGKIKALAAIRGLQLVTVAGTGMMGVPGIAGRIFSTVAAAGISVPLIIQSTSEQRVCFAVPTESVGEVKRVLQNHFRDELARGDIDQVITSDDVGVMTIICPGLHEVPGIAGQIFTTLGEAGVNILGITFGTSEISINLILNAADLDNAVRCLHKLISAPVNEGVK
jgi:bifunctional aspartokinase / homoserine dehydrogenase 1